MIWFTSAVLSLVLQGASGTNPLELADALTAVSRNVKESQDLLPDFLCNEKVTSTRFRSGKQQSQKVVEIDLQHPAVREKAARFSLSMENPARKGAKMPGCPSIFRDRSTS
jgi:hypothetical protein